LSDAFTSEVLAVVLTFDAPHHAANCVTALQRQTNPPGAILVVDNDSAIPVERDVLANLGPVPVAVLRLSENLGPAGGYAAGLERFLHGSHHYAWTMDDDVEPDPDCLAHLVTAMRAHHDVALVSPLRFDKTTGEYWEGWGWGGVLIPRRAVEELGVPDRRLFWGYEDQEYLRDRIPLAGFVPVSCHSAIARVSTRPATDDKPPWKWYYETRNQTYRYLYKRAHVPFRTRLKSLVAWYVKVIRKIWASRRRRPTKYASMARGLVDGGLRRLGKRVAPDTSHRP
jgi:GT2 family glycosyltransferase